MIFDHTGNLLANRTADDCLKLYDIRKFKSPLFTYNNLPNLASL